MGYRVREKGKIESDKSICIEWSAICLPMKGEEICGDDYIVKESGRKVLVAAIDGLGHGSEALEASGEALKLLRTYKDESLIHLVNQCHNRLRNTRGVVMSLATFNCEDNTMSWMGVGNVEGILFRASEDDKAPKETILLRGGVVGYKLPQLKASIVTVSPGDTLIFTTDGVSYGYAQNVDINRPTNEIVNFIASKYVDFSDDAHILVARFTGG